MSSDIEELEEQECKFCGSSTESLSELKHHLLKEHIMNRYI